jgi:fatty acid desaturase
MTALTSTLRPDRPASDYSTLLSRVQQAGLLDRSGALYFVRVLVLATMGLAGIAAIVVVGKSWWQLVVAAFFAVVFAQIGFLGHDAGHQQVFARKRWNDRFGLVLANLGIGLSYGWWVDKHGRHHRNPNEVGADPDVQRNALAWTDEQAESQRGVLRFVARHQAAFFFPLLMFEAWNLHVGSVRILIARPRRHLVEIILLSVHLVGCVALLLVFMSPVQALVFVVVQQSLLGVYLGCSFAPNHKGMPMIDGDVQMDFLRRQVLTSRNVSGGRVLSVVFGGLNFQIEHHLFPSMPMRNLRRCQPIVRGYCAERGVTYCETGLMASYVQALRYLRSVRPATGRS